MDYLSSGRTLSTWRLAERLAGQLNKVAEEAVSDEALSKSRFEELQLLGLAYKRYRQLLEQFNYLDFSTIQMEMLKLLENAEVRETIQNRFDYLMIDEYQDTNTIQEKIVLLLAARTNNLCVVGDDDQALYRFRGASIRNILEFPKRFPDGQCKQIYLTKNYRSHQNIVNHVRRHINCHRFRPGLRETLLTFLVTIKRRLCGIASVDTGLSFL